LLALGELKYLEGKRSHRADVLKESLALAQQALQLDASIPDPFILLAKLAVERRDSPVATDMADRALALAPNKPEALFCKGPSRAVAWQLRERGELVSQKCGRFRRSFQEIECDGMDLLRTQR
jgi:hypothetical protein